MRVAGMVQVSRHQIVDVIAMGYGVVTAAGTMLVRAFMTVARMLGSA